VRHPCDSSSQRGRLQGSTDGWLNEMGRPPKPSKHRAGPRKHGRAAKNTDGRPSTKAAHAAAPDTIPSAVSTPSAEGRAPLPLKRTKTILWIQGTNDITGRPIRVYITSTNRVYAVETLGQLDAIGGYRT
jgi:hypothetical protein